MNQTHSMSLRQRSADLTHEVDHTARRQRPALTHQIGEAEARQIFHHEIKCAVRRTAVIINLDRIRMRQHGGRPHLTLETSQCDRVVFQIGADQLESAGPFQKLMFGEINCSHPSLTQFLQKPILTEATDRLQFTSQPVQHMRRENRHARTKQETHDVGAEMLNTCQNVVCHVCFKFIVQQDRQNDNRQGSHRQDHPCCGLRVVRN